MSLCWKFLKLVVSCRKVRMLIKVVMRIVRRVWMGSAVQCMRERECVCVCVRMCARVCEEPQRERRDVRKQSPSNPYQTNSLHTWPPPGSSTPATHPPTETPHLLSASVMLCSAVHPQTSTSQKCNTPASRKNSTTNIYITEV